MAPGWEHAACPGGVRVTGRGGSLADAFAETALGVFALIVAPSAVGERDRRELRAHGANREALLGNWISECLYLHEVEGFVARRVEFVAFQDSSRGGGEPLRLHAWLHGEEMDEARHGPATVPPTCRTDAVSVAVTPAHVEAVVCLATKR